MNVYAPSRDPMVVFVGSEESGTGLLDPRNDSSRSPPSSRSRVCSSGRCSRAPTPRPPGWFASAPPEFNPTQVRSVLRYSAVDVGPEGPDAVSGCGRLGARAAAEYTAEDDRWAALEISVDDEESEGE